MNNNNEFKLWLGNRTILTLVTLIVIMGSTLATYYFNNQKSSQYNPTQVSDEFRQAVQMAKEQYLIKQKAGMDFRSGPCLDNNLMSNWVADLVHNPRIRSDNQPENQCSN